jgi:hypothetical protein
VMVCVCVCVCVCVHARAVGELVRMVMVMVCVCVCIHAVGEFGADGDGSQEELRQVGGQRIFEELRVPADAFRTIQ